jgi:hypothetical protein
VVRAADGQGGNWTKAIGTADDFDEADGKTVLDFWQAQDHARIIARAGAMVAERTEDLRPSPRPSTGTRPILRPAEAIRVTLRGSEHTYLPG